MHKFLKILILIIALWMLSLPWTLNYLSTLTTLTSTDDDIWETNSIRNYEQPKPEKVVVGMVACGDKALREIVVSLKSVILSSAYHGIHTLDAILFADDDHLYELDIQVKKLKNETRGLNFRYEIHPVIFPAKNNEEWKSLFKPCASQRLFLHTALPHIDKILYLDIDTLVVGDLQKIWGKFNEMSSKQAVGLVAEHELPSIGWYNRFALHPFYPPLGVNTGVMLMNLTKLRTNFQWEKDILNAYKMYKERIVFGDQDLINIIFYKKPDGVYSLPCSFNYRPDHCLYGWNCKSSQDRNGIQILHGNRNVFHNETLFPVFKKLYDLFEKFDVKKDNYIKHIVNPFRKEMETHLNNNLTDKCDGIGELFFKEMKLH